MRNSENRAGKGATMEAHITGGVRTAIGRFNGSLASLDAIDLGLAVIREVVERTGVKKDEVDEVIMGNVIQAGLGQNPARQAAIRGGLPEENVPAFTVNKVCGSGLKSVVLAGQAIAAGEAAAIIAGGMEHMTNPSVVKSQRWGQRLGNAEMIDTLVNDAL